MKAEDQYIDLYQQCRDVICRHSSETMNGCRDAAFERFKANGFPTRKVERYKYTDMQQLFIPDYGLNLNRLPIAVDPYKAFSCDVPNLSTSLFFMVNDSFYPVEHLAEEAESAASPDSCATTGGSMIHAVNAKLPEGVVIGSLVKNADFIGSYYNHLASKNADSIADLNTMLAQDGLLVYVPRHTKVERAVQVINILKAPPRWGGQAKSR